MFYNEFQIYKESDNILEFRYSRNLIYMYLGCCIILYIIILVKAIGRVPAIYLLSLGIILLFIGLIPLIANRKIIVDKNKKKLVLSVGVGKLIRSMKVIKFSQIRYVGIKESLLGFETAMMQDMKDTIYLALRNENNVKLAVSKSDIYSNELTHKLSEAIGCKVVCDRC
jgi:hypothetical protein